MNNENYKIANDIAFMCAIYPNNQELGREIRMHYGKSIKYEKEVKKDQKNNDKKNIYQTNDRHT